jgi:hypothetical protein
MWRNYLTIFKLKEFKLKVEGGDANSKTVTVEQSFNFGKYSAQISYRTRFSIAYASASQK